MLGRFNVSTKLNLLVLVMCAAIAGMGVYGIYELNVMDRDTQTIYADRVFPLQQLTNIRYSYSNSILLCARNVSEHRITFAEAKKQTAAAQKTIDANWKAYLLTYLTPEESKLAKRASASMQQTDAAVKKLTDILGREDYGQLDALIDKELYPTVSTVITDVNSLIDLQVKVSGEVYQNSRQVYASAVVKFAVIIALLILFAIPLVYFIVKDTKWLIWGLEASNRKIAESEERCRAFIENAGDAILVMNNELTITLVNDYACRLLNYTREELRGMKIQDVMAPEERNDVAVKLEVIDKDRGSLHERKFRKKDGSLVDTEVNARALAGTGYISIIRDITERKKAEAAIRESEEKYRSLVEHAGDAIFMIRMDGSIMDINRSACEMLGYTRAELLTMEATDVYPPEMRALQPIQWDLLIKDKTLLNERILQRKDGSRVEVEVSRRMLNDGTGYLAIVRDITERRVAEKKLVQSEEKHRALIENISDAIVLIDRNAEVIFQSTTVERVTGHTLDNGKGGNVFEFVHPDDLQSCRDFFMHVYASPGVPLQNQYRIMHQNGNYIWIEGTVMNMLDNESVNAIVLNYRDITERKVAEQKLIQSEEKLRALVENIGDAIMIVNKRSELIYHSPSFTRVLGYTSADVKEKLVFDIIHPDDSQRCIDFFVEVYATPGSALTEQFRIRHKNGHYIWIEGTVMNLLGDESVNALIVNFRDITDRKMSDEKLRQSEERHRALIENISDAINLVDANAELIYRSPSAQRLNGYSLEDLHGRKIDATIHPDDREPFLELLKKSFATPGLPVSYLYRWHDKNRNDYNWIEGTLTNLFHLESVKAIVINSRNVTERKVAEEKMRQSEEWLRALIANIGDAITVINGKSDILYRSPSVERINGFSLADVTGKTVIDLIYTDDKERAGVFFTKVYNSRGEVLQDQFRMWHKDGHYIWIEGTVINLLDNENIKAIVINYRDITQRKNAEAEITALNEGLEQKVIDRTAQLKEANKELESFSYTVAHDLRAPLRVMSGFSEILIREKADMLDEEGQRLLKVVVKNSNVMGRIIDDLLEFSRLGKVAMSVSEAPMQQLVTDVVDMVKQGNPAYSHVQVNTGNIYTTKCDAGLIRQVWVNLVSNAVKYSAKKEKPVVNIGSEKRNGEVCYYVKDNGAGFDMKFIDKLFGVFSRLHKPSEFEGTGVGLALAQRIVNRHGGKIWAEAKPGEGAQFYFTIPA